jgi:hypothetical protein
MNLNQRKKRIDKISKNWNLIKVHQLMAQHSIKIDLKEELLRNVKLYVSKALDFDFINDEKKFMQKVDKSRSNRKNITPNGAVVPKREYHLEYNLVLRTWCQIVKKLTQKNKSLLKLFRMTPNVRIKFGQELKDNLNRGLSTSIPHSDAWVEGPYGMNCFIPLLGDTKNNNLVYYEPKRFHKKFLTSAKTYNEMQWVMKNYKKINFIPKKGNVYISDYALLHNSFRNKNSRSRISIDTTVFVGNQLPHPDRLKEYRKKIPEIGISEFIDAGKSENEKHHEKKSTFSHYTSGVLKTHKLY